MYCILVRSTPPRTMAARCGYVLETYLEDVPVENDTRDIVPTDNVDSNNSAVDSNKNAIENNETKITIIDSVGNRFEPVGDFRVLKGSID